MWKMSYWVLTNNVNQIRFTSMKLCIVITIVEEGELMKMIQSFQLSNGRHRLTGTNMLVGGVMLLSVHWLLMFYSSSFLFIYILLDRISSLTQFPGFLNEGTARAHCVEKYIHQHSTIQTFLLPQSPPDDWGKVESYDIQQTMKHAVLADTFSVLSNGVARTTEGHRTQAKVSKASKQTILELRTHFELIRSYSSGTVRPWSQLNIRDCQ